MPALDPKSLTTDVKPLMATRLSREEVGVAAAGPMDGAGVTPEALRMLALAFVCMVVCSLDRVAMSVTLLPMSLDFGYTETTKGAISSMFSMGYMTCMLPSGILATSTSPKTLLALGVATWSAAQVLSPYAAHVSLPALLACRFVMGATESVATPCVQQLVASWFPTEVRSRVVSLLASGLNLGTLTAYLATPYVIQSTSWEDVFHLYGGVGFLWLMVWLLLASDRPPNDLAAAPSPPSAAAALATQPSAAAAGGPLDEAQQSLSKVWQRLSSMPWGSFAKSKELWAVAAAHASHNYGLYVALAWLPTYFSQTYGLDLRHSSALSVAPWVAAAVVTNLAGWSADALINNGILDRTATRKLFQCTALLIPAACMYTLSQGGHSPSEAQALFTLSIAGGSMSCAGFATATQDLAQKYIGITYGVTSALSVVVGSIGTYYTGVLLDQTNSWDTAFQLASSVYLAGAVVFAGWYQARKIFD